MSADLILASSSPRRKEILSRLHIPFRVVSPPYEERSSPTRPAQGEALDFAKGKARSVASVSKNAVVIGSDTLIELKDMKIGKPENPEAARAMLKRLQGKSHTIWTAVFLIDTRNGATSASVEKVRVTMFPMTDAEIDEYVRTGEPLDKAGAYAVQGIGQKYIQELKGDRLAAIGLPLRDIISFLRARNFDLPHETLER